MKQQPLSKSQLQTTARSTTPTNARAKAAASSQKAAKNLETTQITVLSQELRSAEQQVAASQYQIRQSKETMADLRAKVRVLEDALLFRSEEMGLAGHAGLLSKVAQLKGEVTALRNELLSKNDRLQSSEEEKETLTHSQEELQHQIQNLTKRLSATEATNHRLANNDIAELLAKTEQERDLLLAYIQQDMTKSSDLAVQLETAESEVRVKTRQYQQLEDKFEALSQQVLTLEERCRTSERTNLELEARHRDLQYQHSVTEQSLAHAQTSLARYEQEDAEQRKRQAAVYAQLQSREKDMMAVKEELLATKSKAQEAEHQAGLLASECSRVQEAVTCLEKENRAYRDRLSTLQPKVLQLEPLVEQLQQDKTRLEHHVQEMTAQLQRTQSLAEACLSLEQGLEELGEEEDDEHAERAERTERGGEGRLGVDMLSSPAPPPPPLPPLEEDASLVSRHARWLGLASLSHLGPRLVRQIRSLAQDLAHCEASLHSTRRRLAQTHEDLSLTRETHDQQLQQLSSQLDQARQTAQSLQTRLAQSEDLVAQGQQARQVLHQVRLVLQAYPAHREDVQRRLGQTLDQIPVSQLPEAVNQALLCNGEAALREQDLRQQVDALTREVSGLYANQQATSHSLRETQQALSSTRDELSIAERQVSNLQQTSQTRLSQAADLVEKQNVLLAALQAKLDSLERDKALRQAQCLTFQQREDHLRQRIVRHERVARLLPASWKETGAGQSAPSLSDLLAVVLDAVGRPTGGGGGEDYDARRAGREDVEGSGGGAETGEGWTERLRKARQSLSALREVS